MSTLLLTHSSFGNHDTGFGHPERPDRMRAIDKVLEDKTFSKLHRMEAPLRDDIKEQILKAHSVRHYELVQQISDQALSENKLLHVDGDTVMSPGSWDAALRAVGAGLQAVDEVMSGRFTNAFAQVRPPGHHAESNRPMGFCFFSNAAISALYVRNKYGAERVAVVDFDVHHGNGTQNIFWSDKDLFYGSTHQMPLFPGTGELNETGVGNIFNAPLLEGDGRDRFREAFSDRIMRSLHNFGPDIIIISAGFDAHKRDPLGGLQLDEDDFSWATECLCEMAEEHSRSRIVSLLEGGYDLEGLSKSVAAHVRTLMDATI